MNDGTLPVLGRLSRQGASSNVHTQPGFGDGALWPSLVTGVTPARHGRFFRRQFKPRSYRRTLFSTDTDLIYEPFWTTLSRAGRRVAVLDLPYSRLESNINGLLLVDWLIHDRYGPPRSCPPDVAARVISEFGDDPIGGDSDRFPKGPANLERLCGHLSARVHMKEALFRKTLGAEPWDLIATAFAEPHDLGHVAWHMRDPSHPSHDADWFQQHGDPLKALYIEIDAAIGRMLADAPPTAAVIVFAGLGMGPNYTATGAMDQILARLERIDDRPTPTLARRIKAAGFPAAAVRIGGMADTVREIASLRRRRFFAMGHNENSGAIRINLAGREPAGRVPASQFDVVCDDLADAFLGIRNCATGQPLVTQVVRVGRELKGECIDTLPDLFMVWNREAPIQAIESPRIGRIDGVRTWGRTGDHTPHAARHDHRPRCGHSNGLDPARTRRRRHRRHHWRATGRAHAEHRWTADRHIGPGSIAIVTARSAVLILNHYADPSIFEQFGQIRRACGPQYDVFLLSDRTRPSLSFARRPVDAPEVRFTARDLIGLGYPGKLNIIQSGRQMQNLKLGNADLPVLLFHAQRGHYRHYWIIEYDVRYSGPWQQFFSAFEASTADLIGTSLIRLPEFPGWSHWRSLQIDGPSLEDAQKLRGFFPIYRVSNAALTTLHAAYLRGASGHMETVLPTVLHQAGLELEDIGGDGDFVKPDNINRFYTNRRLTNELSPGTFVYRPSRTAVGAQQHMLWHPVKPVVPVAIRAINRVLRALG